MVAGPGCGGRGRGVPAPLAAWCVPRPPEVFPLASTRPRLRRHPQAPTHRPPPGRTRAQREFKDAVGQAVQDHLRAACKFAAWDEDDKENQGPSVGRQFNEWWTGASCECAYIHLHQPEIALTQLLPDDEIRAAIPAALARL